MKFQRKANKALALLLALSLVMSTNMPIGVFAKEAEGSSPEFIKSGDTVTGINLNANPVIIESATDISGNSVEGKIQLILDADRDGVADDGESKVSIDGVTEFDEGLSIYGTYNESTDQNICITMNSGSVADIYGALDGNVTSEGESIRIYINGGSVNQVYGFYDTNYYNYSISGTILISVDKAATISGCTVQYWEGSTKYYLDNQGAVTISGDFTIENDCAVTSLTISSGTLTIPESVTVVADSISLGYNTILKLKGTLDATAISGSGKLLVQGGSLADTPTYSYTYYPAEITSTIENAPVAASTTTYGISLTENNVKTLYLLAGRSVTLSAAIEGYDGYYSVDGSEFASVGSGFNFSTPANESVKLELTYVPTQITVANAYSGPKGYVGKTYTAENPLCDLAMYEITGDTTKEYGGEVKYGLKSGNKLPAGLSLSGGKIIGTPTTANETGDKVTFVVTGRNGSTANLTLTIKITGEAVGFEDINDLVTIGSNEIHLNGTSVVIMQGSVSNYSKIYLDADHDKLPDNNIALKVNGNEDIYLGSYRVYGYNNTTVPFEGDISITVKSGFVAYLRGVAGTSEENKATVNGDVSIYVENATMNSTGSSIMGAEYGMAKNVTVEVTDGSFRYTDIYGVTNSTISGDVNYTFADAVYVSAGSSANLMLLYAANDSQIGRNVNIELGYIDSTYGFQSSLGKTYAKYYGVSGTTVKGDVYYTIDGRWYPDENYLIQKSSLNNSVVEGDVNVEWKSVDMGTTYVVSDTEIKGDLKLTAQDGSQTKCSGLYVLSSGSSASDLKVDIPSSCTGEVTLSTGVASDCIVQNVVYINNKGFVTIGGEYTIKEDLEISALTLLAGADVTIDESVTVDLNGATFNIKEGAKLTNNGTLNFCTTTSTYTTSGYAMAGTLENKGVFHLTASKAGNYMQIDATGIVINSETGTWNVASRIYNSGNILNYGSFVQTYSESDFKKLGNVYTTMPLALSGSAADYTYIDASTPYSNLYFAIHVEYPSHCVSGASLSGDNLTNCGLAGDTNQYVKIDQYNASAFEVTLGTQTLDSVVLMSVTYGPDATEATTSDNVTWSGSINRIFEPITVTLNYGAVGEVTPITLDKTTDSLTDLAVDDAYTYDEPLYDLSKLTISGDITAENGKVIYTVKSGSLPEGFVLKDGKLYGTFAKATDAESTIVFTIKGLNQTTAEFTLTLGAVAKAVPDWEIPTGFETTIGKQVGDVELPVDVRGTYAWESSTEAVGETIGTITTNLIFKPTDTENYDWETAAANAGLNALWDGANGSISCTVSITVGPGEPEVTAPTGLTATYGQTLAKVVIPSDENGSFAWDEDYHALTDLVGEVGEQELYVTYTPTSENYKEKSGIKVTLTVVPASPQYSEALTEVSLLCDETLGDIVLPDVDGGKYQWVSATSTAPTDGESYSVIYLPEDTTNYDWSTVDGWHKYRKGVVFSVKVTLDHAWGEGVVTKPPTETQTGVKTYTCGLCKKTRTETIDKLPQTGGGSGSGNTGTGGGGAGSGAEKPQVGFTLSDKSSKAVYKVSAAGKEVSYVKPDKKTYTKVKIPNTIKYGGVTYKVTAIANNACKNNKKLKTVTIGSNIKTIGNNAFQNCTALKSITIPKNVSKIGSKAFYGCKKLMKMTIKTTKLTEKKVGKNAFKNMGSSNYKKVTVKVPKKKLKTYKKMLVKRGLSKKAKVKK